jgi:hypothetical protein
MPRALGIVGLASMPVISAVCVVGQLGSSLPEICNTSASANSSPGRVKVKTLFATPSRASEDYFEALDALSLEA